MNEFDKQDQKRLRISRIITLGALVIALFHLLFPRIKVDLITVTLIIIALIPWLGIVFKVIKIPGGIEVEYRDLEQAKQDAKKAGLLVKSSIEDKKPAFLNVASDDPNLALAGLRLEIEKRLRALAEDRGLSSATKGKGIGSLLRILSVNEVLSQRERNSLTDIIGLLNDAVHGAKVDSRAAEWALDIAPQLLQGLDELIRKPTD